MISTLDSYHRSMVTKLGVRAPYNKCHYYIFFEYLFNVGNSTTDRSEILSKKTGAAVPGMTQAVEA